MIGFTPERRKQAGRQFVDVGIAEEHAVALASGMLPVADVRCTGFTVLFIQRCYDQLSQDLCINGNPAVITVFMGTVAGMNDVTHLASSIFRLSQYPEYGLSGSYVFRKSILLCWNGLSMPTEYPVAIRVPGVAVVHRKEEFDTDYMS